jgi:hypothetical protein
MIYLVRLKENKMYIAIVKNDNNSWDAIFKFAYNSEVRLNMLDAAWEKELPITGMITTNYGLSPKIGSIWNGTEFSGGHERGSIDFPEITATEEQLANINSYSFLCDCTKRYTAVCNVRCSICWRGSFS